MLKHKQLLNKEVHTTEKGFIKLIISLVIGLILLKVLFDFDVISYIESEEFQSFSRGVWGLVKSGWFFILGGYTQAVEYVFGIIDNIN